MCLERVKKTLQDFGLSPLDAKVYVYLATTGPQNSEDLVVALKITKKQLFCSIESLNAKGILASSSGNPILFCALPFEKVLEILIKNEIEQAKAIRKSKKELLSNWCSKEWKEKI